jgi:hypothetical protein
MLVRSCEQILGTAALQDVAVVCPTKWPTLFRVVVAINFKGVQVTNEKNKTDQNNAFYLFN